MALKNGLLIADVIHTRFSPKSHRLRYTVYYLAFPIRLMRDIAGRVLSLKRFNLFGFYNTDHGLSGMHGEDWVRAALQSRNITETDGDIVLVCMPRVLGYVFNPVSFWFCLDKNKQVRAVLAEVSNTYGERHGYLCYHEDKRPIEKDDWIESDKVFHVSPFLEVRGKYAFRFAYSEEKIAVWIDYYDNDEKVLATSMIGTRTKLDDWALIRCFFRYPLVTLKVIGLIHYHALLLVLKGIRFNNKPKPPEQEIT